MKKKMRKKPYYNLWLNKLVIKLNEMKAIWWIEETKETLLIYNSLRDFLAGALVEVLAGGGGGSSSSSS